MWRFPDLDADEISMDVTTPGRIPASIKGYSSSSSSSSSRSSSSSSSSSSTSSSSPSSSSSSSRSSEMGFKWTGCVCVTSSSDSHSGQLRISPSSTSSSSTSISAPQSGQRITARSSEQKFAGRNQRIATARPSYYIPRLKKSTGSYRWPLPYVTRQQYLLRKALDELLAGISGKTDRRRRWCGDRGRSHAADSPGQ